MNSNFQFKHFPDIRTGVELSKLTTFNLGGKADFFYELHEIEKLPNLIKAAKSNNIPYIIIGWGSNTIFSDRGFRGLVIRNLTKNIKLVGETTIVADSGTLLSQIIRFSIKKKLTGMERLIGLPGTIGGAVRGNAGAFGLEIKSLISKVQIYNSDHDLVQEHDPEYFQFAYRHSILKQNPKPILKVWLDLEKGDPILATEQIRKIIISRAGKHPSGSSSGSFFKNPEPPRSGGSGFSAGQLIELAGLKGHKIGGAYISTIHANFLMNDGTATSKDLDKLLNFVRLQVLKKFNIKLELEVHLIDEFGNTIK